MRMWLFLLQKFHISVKWDHIFCMWFHSVSKEFTWLWEGLFFFFKCLHVGLNKRDKNLNLIYMEIKNEKIICIITSCFCACWGLCFCLCRSWCYWHSLPNFQQVIVNFQKVIWRAKFCDPVFPLTHCYIIQLLDYFHVGNSEHQ